MMNDIDKILEELLDASNRGHYQKVGEFVMTVSKNGRLEINGYLPYNQINEIPLNSLPNELKTLKEKFSLLIDDSIVLKDFEANCRIDYFVLLDTGKAGINICAEIEGMYNVFI